MLARMTVPSIVFASTGLTYTSKLGHWGETEMPNAVKANPSFWLSCTVTGIGFPPQTLPVKRLAGPTSCHVPAKSLRTSVAVPVAPTLRSNVAVQVPS